MLRNDASARGGAAARVLKLERELMQTTADKRDAEGMAMHKVQLALLLQSKSVKFPVCCESPDG